MAIALIRSASDFLKVRTRRVFALMGIDIRKRTDDRNILENVIFPYFVHKEEYRKILFVGCAWFTKRYNKLFRNKIYWTIEIDPSLKKFGSKKHIIDSLENVTKHFSENELDLIICNGVFGWGLDEKATIENSFRGCFHIFRNGGVFILGWNDVPEHRPYLLDEIESLRLFKTYRFEPLNNT